jgi:hypothetical protein
MKQIFIRLKELQLEVSEDFDATSPTALMDLMAEVDDIVKQRGVEIQAIKITDTDKPDKPESGQ